jgi:hypothetical protein
MYPFNHKRGQKIQTNAEGVSMDMFFGAHFQVSGANAVAANTDGIMALVNLGAAVQHKSTGLTSPAVPRALRITGNVSGITGNVTLHGTNYNGDTISEIIALNGTTTVEGAKAFKTVSQIDLPAQTHTPAAQTETKQVTHKADAAGTITLTLTAAGLTGSPLAVSLEVELDDTAIEVATKCVAALNDVEAIAAMYTASNAEGTSDTITLTAVAPAADDATLSLAFADTDTTGVTMGSSTNGTAGVSYDKVKVGWNDKLGLPYKLAHNTVLPGLTFLNNVKEGTDPTITVSATALESNTIDLNSALNGTVVDAYLLV